MLLAGLSLGLGDLSETVVPAQAGDSSLVISADRHNEGVPGLPILPAILDMGLNPDDTLDDAVHPCGDLLAVVDALRTYQALSPASSSGRISPASDPSLRPRFAPLRC